MDIKEIEWGDLERNPLAEDMYDWRTHLNTTAKLRVIDNAGNSFTS
jgi:hypothetical protein